MQPRAPRRSSPPLAPRVSPLFETVREDPIRKKTRPAVGAAVARVALDPSASVPLSPNWAATPRIDRVLKNRLGKVGMSACADGEQGRRDLVRGRRVRAGWSGFTAWKDEEVWRV